MNCAKMNCSNKAKLSYFEYSESSQNTNGRISVPFIPVHRTGMSASSRNLIIMKLAAWELNSLEMEHLNRQNACDAFPCVDVHLCFRVRSKG